MLDGRNVVLGVCGSIAAVRCVELVHELRRQGANVRVVMTHASQSIITADALEYASHNPVVTTITGSVEHVELCGVDGWGDVLVIAPATANTVGKMAAAIDDTPVTTCATTALGAGMSVVVVPAMHEPMWEHPGVLDSIETLESWDVKFVPPRMEEGKAKIASEPAILTEVARTTKKQELAGTHLVVTSGPTTESVDPVRILSNRSSGRMGRAIARECYLRGAAVTLLHDGPDVHYATVDAVETGAEMRERAVEHMDSADALISAAAIGDFEVDTADDKLDSSTSHTLPLEPAPKLLDSVRDTHPTVPIVGFKAESGGDEASLERAARKQIDRVSATFVVANDATMMGADGGRAMIVDTDSSTTIEGTKQELATHIVDRLVVELPHTDE